MGVSSLWLGGTGSRPGRPRTPCGSRVGPDSWRSPAETGATWPRALVSVRKNQSPARGYLSPRDILVAAAGQREGSWVPVLVLSGSPGPLQLLQGPPSPITTALAMEPGAWEGAWEAAGRCGSRLLAGGLGGFSQATALPEQGPCLLGQSSSVRAPLSFHGLYQETWH